MLLEAGFCYRRSRWSGSPLYFYFHSESLRNHVENIISDPPTHGASSQMTIFLTLTHLLSQVDLTFNPRHANGRYFPTGTSHDLNSYLPYSGKAASSIRRSIVHGPPVWSSQCDDPTTSKRFGAKVFSQLEKPILARRRGVGNRIQIDWGCPSNFLLHQ